MCGIFGYAGSGNAAKMLLDGLKRLEYRGYDSWGVAVVAKDRIVVEKNVGAIGDLSSLGQLPVASMGIGHTRWATHGGVTYTNAHPHYSTDGSFVLAQNGIVENYQALKHQLQHEGFHFETETDTEVIVRLVEKHLKTAVNLTDAIKLAFLELDGRNTIIVLSALHDQIIAVRNGSPLVVGVNSKEFYFASDTLSFADKTNEVIFIENMQLVEYVSGIIRIEDLITGQKLPIELVTLDQQKMEISKEGFEHYMLKEIFEQRQILVPAVDYSMTELKPLLNSICRAKTVIILGAGGAFYAADQVAYLLRTLANVNAIGIRAYEIESYLPIVNKDDVVIAVSQSGETADTIEALDMLAKKGIRIASVVNMWGSTISRMSDYAYYSRSGSEICVLSTKSGAAQVAFGYLLAMSLGGKHELVKKEMAQIQTYLSDYYLTETLVDKIGKIAKKIVHQEHLFILGRGANNVVSLVGALNIKEASYMHAEGFSGGELKHGVIALIEENTPIICIVDNDENMDYMIGAVAEVKSRGAYVIALANEPNDLYDERIPLPTGSKIHAGIVVNIIPCQLLAYQLAVLAGHNPDKPRNLAKSVTVT